MGAKLWSWSLLARAVAAGAAMVLLLAGCSAGGSGGPGPGGPAGASSGTGAEVSDADRHFVTRLGPHHDQAVEMSGMLLAKTSGVDPEVRALAEEIQTASEEEIEELDRLRTAWGPATAGQGGEEDGAGHHGGADGLMTEAQMRQLDRLDGWAGQQLYLDGMVRHHQGAAAIAEAQVREGRHPGAVALARQVLDRQQAQIAALQDLQHRG